MATNVSREVAVSRQDSLADGGLPAELGASVIKAAGDDTPALFLVALRLRDAHRPDRR